MTAGDGAWAAVAPLDELRVRARGADAAQANPELAAYLDAAGLHIARLDEAEELTLRMTRFPELSFAHLHAPAARVEWTRDAEAHGRTAIVLCTNGRLTVESSGAVLHRRPGMFLLPPGDDPVTFETRAPLSELLCITAPAALVAGLELAPHSTPRPPLSPSALTPLYAFATSLSGGSASGAIAPLRSAAMEVARALARLIAESDPGELTPFTRAMRLIDEGYADPRLSVPRLAHMIGVSERSLQAVFAAEGTSVAKELRATRARAARELRRARPHAPAHQIATAAGFGSVSSLYRAIDGEAERAG
ncbi:hypothetical protein LLS1_13460 [Leifsonia sp. LS1]|uniref:helix-turn-helix domain-containing protein n=1 Tax=Leifsonia sp. LS1 TaxID=2828483 RepID=UPI001CFF22A5|nr:helix-turn-helix domain-containing protein [Leifsonia sp. LS1]GIT79677.1 hypothetical protein LLS1_13460 [Leifsonia sp. LS1]